MKTAMLGISSRLVSGGWKRVFLGVSLPLLSPAPARGVPVAPLRAGGASPGSGPYIGNTRPSTPNMVPCLYCLALSSVIFSSVVLPCITRPGLGASGKDIGEAGGKGIAQTFPCFFQL